MSLFTGSPSMPVVCQYSKSLMQNAVISIVHFSSVLATAVTPASEGEAVVRSPTNMAAAKIAAVDFNKINKMTSLDWHACSHICWGRSASQSTASNASAVGRKKSRDYLI